MQDFQTKARRAWIWGVQRNLTARAAYQRRRERQQFPRTGSTYVPRSCRDLLGPQA